MEGKPIRPAFFSPGTKSGKVLLRKTLSVSKSDGIVLTSSMDIWGSWQNYHLENLRLYLISDQKVETISSDEVQTSVRLLLLGELTKHAVMR